VIPMAAVSTDGAHGWIGSTSVRLRWDPLALLLLLPLAAAGCGHAPPTRPATVPQVVAPAPQPTAGGVPRAADASGAASGSASAAPPGISPAQVETAVAARPRDYEIRMRAAQYYMARGENAAAVPHLEAATRLRPGEALAWMALGDARTLVIGRSGASRGDAARAAYERARRLAPGDPRIDRGLGQILVREGRLEAARVLLAGALRRHPESVDLRLALGNLYLVLNRPALAIAVLQPATAAAPASADVHYLLGQAYEGNLQIQAALREQQAAVEADPSFVEAHGRIGLYLINLTRYAEARPPLREAIRLNPRESHYYWALGDSYLLDTADPGHLGRAIDLYHQALALDPRNEKALMSLALALTRQSAPGVPAGRPPLEEAVRVLERLVRQNPEHTNALYKLYEANARLGRAAAARDALARFRALESRGRHRTAHRYQTVAFVDTAEAHLRLGRHDLAEGRAALAATEFRLALQRNPQLAAARAGLAAAQRRQSGGRD
jgi:tetratricopeptide (TPR) repeat protein